MYKILLIEDDEGIQQAIAKQCLHWGYDVLCASDYKEVLHTFLEYQPHLVLLDITLPYYDGFHWCSEIRKISNTPIIFISSATERMNILMAMHLGADDFIEKPFDLDVLIAKIQALLRRSYTFSSDTNALEFHGAILDISSQSILYKEKTITLTKNEFLILSYLVKYKGTVVSREKLMNALWQTDAFIDDNTLSVNINRLRKKMEEIGLKEVILTKFKVGYVIP